MPSLSPSKNIMLPRLTSHVRPLAALLALVAAVLLTGCGQATHHFVKKGTDTTSVSFDVNLERSFVSSVSSIGGGQAAMLILVGPFTNNAVLLVAKQSTPNGESIAFRERLKWGKNTFTTELAKNNAYQLVVAVQGTRTGMKEIGTVQVGGDDQQRVTVNLLEHEVSVK